MVGLRKDELWVKIASGKEFKGKMGDEATDGVGGIFTGKEEKNWRGVMCWEEEKAGFATAENQAGPRQEHHIGRIFRAGYSVLGAQSFVRGSIRRVLLLLSKYDCMVETGWPQTTG